MGFVLRKVPGQRGLYKRSEQCVHVVRVQSGLILHPPVQDENEGASHVLSQKVWRNPDCAALARAEMTLESIRDLPGQDSSQLLVNDSPRLHPHYGNRGPPMVENVLENVKTEAGDALLDGASMNLRRVVKRPEEIVDESDQQLIFSAEMHVEGGATHVRAIQDLLYRDFFVRLFESERTKRLMQKSPGLFNPAIFRLFLVCLHIHGQIPRFVPYRTVRSALFFKFDCVGP